MLQIDNLLFSLGERGVIEVYLFLLSLYILRVFRREILIYFT